MKKALVIMNGSFVNQHIITTAANIAKLSATTLHAFFLTHDTKSPEFDYLFPNDLSLTQNRLTGKSFAEENAELVKANIKLFIDECERKGVKYVIEPDTHTTLKQIINYSAFSDFMMADAKTNLDQYRLGDLLADAHCPIFLTSTRIDHIKRVIFTYDGSYSSMYAIKMYSYIFSEWTDIETHLLYIASNMVKGIPFEERIKGWTMQHYNNIKIDVIPGNIHENLVAFINSGPEETLVVMGAYGRSNLSRIIHKSLADKIMEKSNASLFIVHE